MIPRPARDGLLLEEERVETEGGEVVRQRVAPWWWIGDVVVALVSLYLIVRFFAPDLWGLWP